VRPERPDDIEPADQEGKHMYTRSGIALLLAAPLLACSLPCFSQTADAARIRSEAQPLTPVINTVAGGGPQGYYGDGELAVNAALNDP
jgi:hypothetical protein